MEREGEPLLDFIAEVSFYFLDDLDFANADPDAIGEIVRRLSIAAFRFNHLVVSELGGRSGLERESGLVELGIASAFQTYRGRDLHPGPFRKAAAMWRSITQGHPFEDGNKRTGILTATYYLERVGFPRPRPFPDEAIYDFSIQLSQGAIRDVRKIELQLKRWWKSGAQSSLPRSRG